MSKIPPTMRLESPQISLISGFFSQFGEILFLGGVELTYLTLLLVRT